MDVIINPETNRLTILLNGTSHFFCNNDFDCPGIAHCRSQKDFAWIEGENSTVTQCICPWYLGTQGALCDEQTSYTWGLFFIVFASSILASFAFLICLYVLVTVWKTKRKSSQALWMSISPMILTSFFTLVYAAQWQERMINVDAYDNVIEVNGLPGKRTSLWIIERASFIIAFVLFVFSLNNFSLLWIEVLNSATMVGVSNKTIFNVRNYKIFLVVFYVISFVIIVVFLTRGEFDSIAFVCAPGLILVCVFYVVAWRKALSAEHFFTLSTDSSTPQTVSVKKLLDKVRHVAAQVFVVTFLLIIISFLYAIIENRPNQYSQQYLGMLIWLLASIDQLFVSIFFYRTSFDSNKNKQNVIDSQVVVKPGELESNNPSVATPT
jgi:hypothetical protein